MKKIFYLLILGILILNLNRSNTLNKKHLEEELLSVRNVLYINSQKYNLEEIESIIEYGDHLAIGAHFPILGIDTIDSMNEDIILKEINSFKSLVQASPIKDPNYKSELNIDYETYGLSNNRVSITFTILKNLTYYDQPNISIISKAYELENGKLLELQDISNEIPIATVSSVDNHDLVPRGKGNIVLPNLSREIDPNKPMVALTFDDGPNRNTTLPILDTLKEYDGVATFFILGNRVASNRDILKRMVEEGSEIGNHSFNHKQLTTVTSSELEEQINKTQDAIMDVVGSKPKLIRPTYGSYDDNLKAQINMPIILWSIDTMDWKSKNAEKISNHVLTHVKDGDIILMHDIYGSTADAIKTIVPQLVNQGYQLVTVSELYKLRNEVLEVGNIYNRSYRK